MNDESLTVREQFANKFLKEIEDLLNDNDVTKCYDCEKILIERETEISEKAYRKGFNVGVLGLSKQLMGLFSEARAKEHGDNVPIFALRTFILAYSAGLIGSSYEDDIDELGNTFNDKMEDIIKEVEKTL